MLGADGTVSIDGGGGTDGPCVMGILAVMQRFPLSCIKRAIASADRESAPDRSSGGGGIELGERGEGGVLAKGGKAVACASMPCCRSASNTSSGVCQRPRGAIVMRWTLLSSANLKIFFALKAG
jgi:hypothetical protein